MPKTFWQKVLNADGGISSKRLMGIICIVFAMFFALLGLFLGVMGNVDGIVSTIVIEFLAAGVALFGVTAWERRNKIPGPVENNYGQGYGQSYDCTPEYGSQKQSSHNPPPGMFDNDEDEEFIDG